MAWIASILVAVAPCIVQPHRDSPKEQPPGQEPQEIAAAVEGAGPVIANVVEFRKFLEQTLRWKGSLIAVYEPVNAKVSGRATIGFDAASGAWFGVGWTEAGGSGRDPTGMDFSVGPRKGSARPAAGEMTLPSPLGTAGHFPSAVLYFLAANPESIRSVERRRDDGWIVGWQLPTGLNGHEFPLAFIEVAPDGTPVKRWNADPANRREENFNYAPNSPPGFPVLAKVGPPESSMALAHIEFFAGGSLTHFSQENVAAACYDNAMIVEMKQQAVAAGIPLGTAGEATSGGQGSLPFTGRQWARLRWPLVIAGAIIVALAGIEVYRRRSG